MLCSEYAENSGDRDLGHDDQVAIQEIYLGFTRDEDNNI